MVSFTGSTAVGRQILAQAAPTVKRVSLELGGKSAQIYLDDAIDLAGIGAMVVVAMTSGQACVAATRMLVPQDAQGRGRRGGQRARTARSRSAIRPTRPRSSAR